MARADRFDHTNVVFHPTHDRPYNPDRQGRLGKNEALPEKVEWLRKPREPMEATPETLLLSEIASAMPPKAYQEMLTRLRSAAFKGNGVAFASLQIALGCVR